jgi:hypothetical protein
VQKRAVTPISSPATSTIFSTCRRHPVILDEQTLQSAAAAFARGEIDRAELMRRITR